MSDLNAVGSPLPEFERPPVNETVLSFQFEPIPNFGIPHFGLYWNTVRDRYSQFEVVPALDPIQEQFPRPHSEAPQGVRVEFGTGSPPVRCWYSDGGNSLIQLQNGRFIVNWRKLGQDVPYPRYPEIKQSFQDEWAGFCAFLKSEGWAVPEVNQCEVSYINHIECVTPDGTHLTTSDILRIGGEAAGEGFLPRPSAMHGAMTFDLPDEQGRLSVSFKPATRKTDQKALVMLELTARGKPVQPSTDAALAWLDTGREWVVRGFDDMTSEVMHTIWGKR